MPNPENIPWKMVPSGLGEVPFYIVQFDKDGNCSSPAALDHLVETSKTKTDVFVFSHGWNNDWGSATSRYDRFVQHFIDVRRQRWNPPARTFAPVLVGVFWPSTALVTPGERGPDIAAGGLAESEVGALADALEPDKKSQVPSRSCRSRRRPRTLWSGRRCWHRSLPGGTEARRPTAVRSPPRNSSGVGGRCRPGAVLRASSAGGSSTTIRRLRAWCSLDPRRPAGTQSTCSAPTSAPRPCC